MKKLLFVSLAIVFALAMFVPQATAGGEKVAVCHIIAANDVVEGFLGTSMDLYFGKVIQVAESAVEAHLAHGDAVSFFVAPAPPAPDPIEVFRAAGVKLPAANCWIGITDGGQSAPLQ